MVSPMSWNDEPQGLTLEVQASKGICFNGDIKMHRFSICKILSLLHGQSTSYLTSVYFIVLSLFPAMFPLLHKPYSLDTVIVLTFSEHNTIHELA